MKRNLVNYPLISIAIVTYNQKEYLKECISSCLAQSYPNFELIISDDFSTDGTKEYLQEVEKTDGRIKVVYSDVNTGITKNYNRACKSCLGIWIKPIAGDDKLDPDCLLSFYEYSLGNNFDVIFSDCISFSKTNTEAKIYKPCGSFIKANKENKSRLLLVKNRLNAPTCFIKRQVLVHLGYADERFVMLEDYPLWLKICQAGFNFGYLPEVLVYYRTDESTYNNIEKIGHLLYFKSVYDFQKSEIWPQLTGIDKLKIIDDWAFYTQRRLWLTYFKNRKSFPYNFYSLIFLPFRVFTLLNRFLKR